MALVLISRSPDQISTWGCITKTCLLNTSCVLLRSRTGWIEISREVWETPPLYIQKKPRHRESFSASHWRDALYPLRKEVLLTQQHCIRKLTKQDSWGELSQCSAVCPLRMGWWLLTSIDSSQPLMKTGATSRVPRNAQNGVGEQGVYLS